MASFGLTDQIKQALYAGWNDQNSINGDWAANGDNKYYSYLQKGGTPLSQDPGAMAIQNKSTQDSAQYAYKQATDKAVAGLQGQKDNLGQQYSDLLKTVKGQYDPLIAQETATAGAAESARGLTPDSQLYQQQVQGALAPVYGQEAANTQQIGQGSIADTNALTQAIASMQSGNAQFGAGLPLQYGQLAMQQTALPSSIQLALAQSNAYNAQANNIGVPQGGMIFHPSNGQYASPIQSVLKQLGINLVP